jgi:hypothetical protein
MEDILRSKSQEEIEKLIAKPLALQEKADKKYGIYGLPNNYAFYSFGKEKFLALCKKYLPFIDINKIDYVDFSKDRGHFYGRTDNEWDKAYLRWDVAFFDQHAIGQRDKLRRPGIFISQKNNSDVIGVKFELDGTLFNGEDFQPPLNPDPGPWFDEQEDPEGGEVQQPIEEELNSIDLKIFTEKDYNKIINDIKNYIKNPFTFSIEKTYELESEELSPNELLFNFSETGSPSDIKLALEKGADIHAKSDYALRLAAENDNNDVVEFLLKNGANIHAGNDNALYWASNNGDIDLIELLLKNGANIHAPNVLSVAVEKDHKDVIELLLKNGANINPHVRYSASGHKDIEELLKKYEKI